MILRYDPIHGKCIPDALVESYILENKDSEEVLVVGSEILITCARALWAEGRLPSLELYNRSDPYPLGLQKDGSIDFWPRDFCSLNDSLLDRLIKIRLQ